MQQTKKILVIILFLIFGVVMTTVFIAEEETERGTIIRQVEEEAERSISVSKPNENLRKVQQVQRKDRNESRYSKICKSWIGHNINDLVDKWGYPTENFKAPNGNKVYVYYKPKTIRIPGQPEQRAPGFISERLRWAFESPAEPAREYHFYCKTFFETDRSGKIIKVRWEGNNCQ